MNSGAHSLPASEYHADPCEQPSLSSGIANILCNRSPAHAWAAHPKLNPNYQRREDATFDVGTAAHSMMLERENVVVIVPYDDWRTNAAKDIRDKARSEGKIPLLSKTMDEVTEMLTAVTRQLGEHRAQPPLFAAGLPEQTLIWEEPGDVTCRARLDWLRSDRTAIDDLKTTTRSASPEAYARTLFNVGGDVQASFYIRGCEQLYGITPEFRWCVVETSPPYALSVISPGPDILAIGQKKVEFAINRWRECMNSKQWPGYPKDVCYAELPAWEEARWLERETSTA